MNAPDFDRSKPLYRLFELDDGANEWWTVELDNTPGRKVSESTARILNNMVFTASWRDAFQAAFAKHKKATVYTPVREIDATLKHAVLREISGADDGSRFAWGFIFGDRKARWEDGHRIHTSLILAGPDEDGIIHTCNSSYKIERHEP